MSAYKENLLGRKDAKQPRSKRFNEFLLLNFFASLRSQDFGFFGSQAIR